jgi:hypothetical protein
MDRGTTLIRWISIIHRLPNHEVMMKILGKAQMKTSLPMVKPMIDETGGLRRKVVKC